LLTGSPAINAGTNTGCPPTDQRGYNRDAACDMGAYEHGASGAAGGAILSSAPDRAKPSVQLARFDTEPRVLGDAPVMAALALLDPPPVTEVVTKTYYYAGSQLIAMRVLTGTTGNTLYYLHTDHLGSTSLTTNITGTVVARQYYYPYGGVRPGPDNALPTDRTFTGQVADPYTELLFLNARYYDPYLNRRIQPDTIVVSLASLKPELLLSPP
jgi:RHS repeat-associated protein